MKTNNANSNIYYPANYVVRRDLQGKDVVIGEVRKILCLQPFYFTEKMTKLEYKMFYFFVKILNKMLVLKIPVRR